jgi:hypothetical protein
MKWIHAPGLGVIEFSDKFYFRIYWEKVIHATRQCVIEFK